MFKFVVMLICLTLVGCRTAGADVREEFSLPYSEAGTAQVTLDMTAGELKVRPVEGGEGVSGVITTNVGTWAPTTTTQPDGTILIRQGSARTDVIPNAENQWQVNLSVGTPLDLNVSAVAANSILELGGLTLPQLTVVSVTGNTTVNYADPLIDTERSVIEVNSTSGDISMSGLLNSFATTIQSVSTIGNQTLEFGGAALNHDMRANVESSAGSVMLRIAAGVPANVKFLTRGGIIAERSPEFVAGPNDTYTTEGFSDTDQPRLYIEVETVAGDLRIVSVPSL
ncbi:MAG: toast rack family protein [Anaerolineae bacterium]|nr:toast rack family protein [Anaerolineae bacterium]